MREAQPMRAEDAPKQRPLALLAAYRRASDAQRWASGEDTNGESHDRPRYLNIAP